MAREGGPVDFEEWLRAEIERRGWSLSELARRVGVAQGTVSRWVSGERRPDYHSTLGIARVLEIDEREVLVRAGHQGDPAEGVAAEARELEDLRARRERIGQQIRQGRLERDNLDKRIAAVEYRMESRIRPRSELRVESGLVGYPGTGGSDGPRDRLSDLLEVIDYLLPVEERVTEQFLRDVRDEWTVQELEAFAAGLRLGMRLGRVNEQPGEASHQEVDRKPASSSGNPDEGSSDHK